MKNKKTASDMKIIAKGRDYIGSVENFQFR